MGLQTELPIEVLKEIITSMCLKLLSFLCDQTWLIPPLLVLLVIMGATLRYQNVLRKKLFIEGKPYHDIMLDLLYFARNKAPNKCKIDTLKWDFVCTYHPGSQDFLDIKEQWSILFSAKSCTVSTLKLGIHGGCPEDLQKETIMAYQDNIPLNLPKPLVITWEDCELISFPLNSDVKRGEPSEFKLCFEWHKFIVVNRKDDYFYFLPKALSNSVAEFHLNVKHPYNCEPVVYFLKHTLTFSYIKRHITQENQTKFKASLQKKSPMEFEFSIKDLGPLDVILIIFSRSDNLQPNSPS